MRAPSSRLEAAPGAAPAGARRRIRVLEVLEATAGGTRTHLISLLRGLDRSAFEVEVAGPPIRDGHDLDSRFAEEVEALDVPLHPVKLHRSVRPLADLRGVLALARIMRRGRYDVAHLHSSKAGVLGRIAAKLNGIPTVYTPNGFYFLNARSRLARRFFLFAEQVAGYLTDHLIAVSDSERDATIRTRTVAASKVSVIPNAIETGGLGPDADARARGRQELRLAPDAPVVGTVSRFIAQKDPVGLIRAFRAVLDRVPGARLVWCGEGGDLHAETLRLARELGVLDAIHFLGFRHDAQQLMHAFDVFVLSSVFEGMPYALLEAMAVDVPAVVTDVVGSRDVVVQGETGLLVPPHEPERLGAAIAELLDDPQRRRAMGRRAGERVRERHDLGRMVRAIEEVYRAVVAGVGRQREPGPG